MDDIFDEVEADLRADRTRVLLTRFGGWLAALAVLVVAGVAAWQGWRWHQGQQDRAMAQVYLAAMDAAAAHPGDKAALAGFAEVAERGPEGYRNLARLQEAGMKFKAGDAAGAEALWHEVSTDAAADPLLRQLAELLAIGHQLDTGNPAQLEARLRPLAEPDNPWHSLAQEAEAVLDLRQGRADQARVLLRGLAQDMGAPQGVRQRAGEMLAQLGS